jgi:hypothetical protein
MRSFVELTEKIWAREQIRDRLHLYCKGIDRRDWALVRSCFSDDHEHSQAGFVGTADQFIEFAQMVLQNVAETHHTIGNVHINLADDGLSATTEANFIAYHRIDEGHFEGTMVPTGGKATDVIVAGRYCDTMQKRDGQWIIVKRDGLHEWQRIEEAKF